MKRLALYPLLLVVPVLMAVTTLRIDAAMGPSWVGMNHDPGLQYVLNSLNFATLRPVGHTVHPGTPVQMAGAFILRAVHLIDGTRGEDLQTDVLSHPDRYLSAIQLTFLFLQSVALFVLGAVVLQTLHDASLALIAQIAPFYAHTTGMFLFGTAQLRPDSAVFVASVLLAAGLLAYAHRATELRAGGAADADRREALQRRATLFFALLCGGAMAAKVGFLPLLVIPLFVLEDNRHRLWYLLGLVAAFVFMTLPILAEYGRMLIWLIDVVIHSGVHGTGSTTVINPGQFVANLKAFVSSEIAFSVIVGTSVGVLAVAYVVPRFRRVSVDNMYFRSLLAVACAQVAGLVIVAKHSQGWENYYLMPVTILTGVTLMLTVCSVAMLVTNSRRPWGEERRFQLASAAVLVGAIAVTFHLRANEIVQVERGQTLARDQRMHVHALVDREYPGCAKIYYLGSSAPEFALFFSNSEANFYYSAALAKLYPDVYFYDPFTSQFSDWYNKPTAFDAISSSHGGRVVIQGPRFAQLQADVSKGETAPDSFRPPPVPLVEAIPAADESVYRQRQETIYVLRAVPSRAN